MNSSTKYLFFITSVEIYNILGDQVLSKVSACQLLVHLWVAQKLLDRISNMINLLRQYPNLFAFI